MKAATTPCPCGRTDARARPMTYAACCGRYLDHWDEQPAPDAESLMRSRYSAFVLQRADYLLATWHAPQRPPSVDFDAGARWLGRKCAPPVRPATTPPRSNSSPATASPAAPCACTSAAASCARAGAGSTSMVFLNDFGLQRLPDERK